MSTYGAFISAFNEADLLSRILPYLNVVLDLVLTKNSQKTLICIIKIRKTIDWINTYSKRIPKLFKLTTLVVSRNIKLSHLGIIYLQYIFIILVLKLFWWTVTLIDYN